VIHLVITSANFPREQSQAQLGYPFELRVADYLTSFHHALRFQKRVDSITILETVARKPIDFLEQSGIPVHYSKCNNGYPNKGVNEVLHLWNFMSEKPIANDDIIIKLTGRYVLLGLEILDHFTDQIEVVAKNDGDIYDPSNRGVHTFLWAFRKRFLGDFVEQLDRASANPIEWHVKAFARRRKAVILEKEKHLGVITCLYSSETGLWRRAVC
jgi:hypothetical protein